jgi:hypothetical protein
MATPYQSGAQQVMGSYNFKDPFDVIREERSPELIKPYCNFFTGMAELFADSKASSNIWYKHYERDRISSKIKASTAGGAVGNGIVFTLDADAINAFEYDASPAFNTGTTTGDKGFPVKAQDRIAIVNPANTATNAMIYATVTAVDKANNQFTAYAENGTAIPALTDQEIMIWGVAMGEAGELPAPTQFTTSDYTNWMSKGGYRTQVSHTASSVGYWVEGTDMWSTDALNEHMINALRIRDMMNMLGNSVSNDALTNLYGTSIDSVGLFAGNGLFPEIWDRGNEFVYSDVTGPTLQYWKNISRVLLKQGSPRESFVHAGQNFYSKTNDVMRDSMQDGAVSYGIFDSMESKKISFDYDAFKIDRHSFILKEMMPFNDPQTFGAEGYKFENEAFIMPNNKVLDPESNQVVSPVRMRYLEKDGAAGLMRTKYYDGSDSHPDGKDVREFRMYWTGGIEAFAMQHWGWARQG